MTGKLPLSLARPLTAAPAVSHQRERTSETRLMRLSPDRRLWRERETGAVAVCTPPIFPGAPSRRLLISGELHGLAWAPLTSLAHVCAQTRPYAVQRVHLCVVGQVHTCTRTLVCTSTQQMYLHRRVNGCRTCPFTPVLRQKGSSKCTHTCIRALIPAHPGTQTCVRLYSHMYTQHPSLCSRKGRL